MKALLVLLMLATTAYAVGPSSCRSVLRAEEVAAAMGPDIRVQPVFSGGEMRGWRVYGTKGAKQLEASGITEGSLLTHVCSVPLSEVFKSRGDICCPDDASHQFEVRFRSVGKEKRFLILREK